MNNGLDWTIAIAIPESDFITEIHANTRQTIFSVFISFRRCCNDWSFNFSLGHSTHLKIKYCCQKISLAEIGRVKLKLREMMS
jgi:hypothetical protein